MFKLGREYMLSSQNLEIYQIASAYKGPVCILHGKNDDTVPLWCTGKSFEQIKDEPDGFLAVDDTETVSTVLGTWCIYREFF